MKERTTQLVAALLVISMGGMLSRDRCNAQDDAAEYFQMARAYADGMIEVGRDRYGKHHSPAFVATLDLRTMKMPLATSNATRQMYSSFFRAEDYSTSVNPMYHIDLYQLLEALTVLTGDPKYRQAARDSIEWFFNNTQNPTTGLMAWGEHLAWDLIEDKITVGSVIDGEFRVSDTHEFYGPWLHWKTTCEVAPDAARRFAFGLWEHQIYDHETCDFSRHARYSKHGPRRGYEFARQAGFYLDTWASVYQATKEAELLVAVEKFVESWERRQNPKTGLLPFEGRSPDVVFVLHNLSFAVDGWEAATKLPEPLAGRLKALIRSVDEAILNLETDLTPGGEGFPKIADANTGEVTNQAMAKARPSYTQEFINQRYSPYGGLWASVYGAGSYTGCEARTPLRLPVSAGWTRRVSGTHFSDGGSLCWLGAQGGWRNAHAKDAGPGDGAVSRRVASFTPG